MRSKRNNNGLYFILFLAVIIVVGSIRIGINTLGQKAKPMKEFKVTTPLLGPLDEELTTSIEVEDKGGDLRNDTTIEEWDYLKNYSRGDEVKYGENIFKAKCWNQGEEPLLEEGESSWECLSINRLENTIPIVEEPPLKEEEKFKVIGCFPEWQKNQVADIPYEQLTHIYYSFAIPKEDGSILPLGEPEVVEELMTRAHDKGVKVLLRVGGKEHEGDALDKVFALATQTEAKCKKLAVSIINRVNNYGFDGVDIDWEYPKEDDYSKEQYSHFIYYLKKGLGESDKLLTVSISPGITTEGKELRVATGYDDSVFSLVDWVNILAYGEDEKYLTTKYAMEVLEYWGGTRKIPKEKLVLGVNFYTTPGEISYAKLVEENKGAYFKDQLDNQYYNGMRTIEDKTVLALKATKGMLIWEVMGDTKMKNASLLNVIKNIVEK